MSKESSAVFNTPPPDFVPVEMDVVVYYPTRLEYFAASALQGLLTGRSEKDRRVCAKQAVALAQEIIDLVDSA